MDDYSEIKNLEPFWGNWYISKILGKGNFGNVFEIIKEELSYKYFSALKVIVLNINSVRQEFENLSYPSDSFDEFLDEYLKEIIYEVRLLYSLRGNSNIVSYEDHSVIHSLDKKNIYILLRMENLKSLKEHLDNNSMTFEEILNLLMDILSALEICQKNKIIHRDIKESNIFLSPNNKFKLGDFGISKQLLINSELSIKGTPLYLAPEAILGYNYDIKSDIYSLGIVFYKLFNKRLFPFAIDEHGNKLNVSSQVLLNKRISIKELPKPLYANSPIHNILNKACASDPLLRYQTPKEFKLELLNLLKSISESEKKQSIWNPEKNIALITDQSDYSDQTELLTENSNSETTEFFTILNTPYILENSESYHEIIINPLIANTFKNCNIQSNYLNGGLITKIEEKYYISDISKSFAIYEINFIENRSKILIDDFAWNLISYKKDIYYINSSIDDKLYKICSINKIKQLVVNKSIKQFTIYKDFLIYLEKDHSFDLYIVNIDNNEVIKLYNKASTIIGTFNNLLYFIHKENHNIIFSYDLLTCTLNTFAINGFNSLIMSNNVLYYINENNMVFSYDLTNNLEKEIVRISNHFFNVSQNCIYYSDKENHFKLTRYNMNLNIHEVINNTPCEFINIIDNFIILKSIQPDSSIIIYNEKNRTRKSLQQFKSSAFVNEEHELIFLP